MRKAGTLQRISTLLLFILLFFYNLSYPIPKNTTSSSELASSYIQNFDKGLNSQKDGNFDLAILYFKTSLEFARKINNPKNECESLLKLGLMFWNIGILKESTKYYSATYTLAKKANLDSYLHLSSNYIRIYELYTNGKKYRVIGQFDESIDSFQEAIDLSRTIRSKEHELKCLRLKSSTHLDLNDLLNFRYLNETAQNIAKSINHKRSEGRCSNNLGLYYLKLNNYSKALIYFENALQIAIKLKNKVEMSNCYNNMGICYKNIGDFDKSLNYLEKALSIDRELDNPYNIANDLNDIGTIFRNRSIVSNNDDFLTEALSYYHKCLETTKRITGNQKNKIELIAHNNIGSVLSDLENYYEALNHFQLGYGKAKKLNYIEGMGMIQNNIGIVHSNIGNFIESTNHFQNAINLAMEIKNGKILWETYLEMARNFFKQNKYDEALKKYKDSIATIENIRSQIDLEELKASYLGTNKRLEAYQEIINLLHILHQDNRDKSYDKEAFEYLEKAKARAFLDRLAISPVEISTHVDFKLQNREKEIEKDISNILTKLYASGLSEEDNALIQQELQEKEYEYETLKREIRTKNPAYADLVYPEIVTLEETQNNILDSHTAFFEYLLGKEKSLVFVITKRNFQIFSLPSKEEIQTLVSNYLKALSDRENHDFHLGQDLFKSLVSPGLNDKIEDIILIPDDILHFLPFETLISEQKNWLIQDYNIAYTPSISAYKAIHARKKANGTKQPMDLLAFGDPDFGKLEAEDNTDNPYFKTDKGNGKSFPRLKFSGTEINKISRLFKKARIKTFVRQEASEEILKNHRLDDYKIIHFATHSRIDNKQPTRSHIILSLDDDPTENGFLEAREIYNLKLNSDLITLSACETGLGKFIKGEGIEGLNRAFFYAGSSSVLMSLWPVNDQATYQLMERFYTHLHDSEPIMDSLRQAKLEMIKSGVLSHPFYWAGFIISGKSDHVIFRKTYKTWIVPAVLILLMGSVIFFVKNKNGRSKKKM